jgi:hypothetical protein
MGSEASLWTNLRAKLTALYAGIDVMRVENTTQDGTPDVNMCFEGDEVWVELKHVHAFPKRETTTVGKKEWIRRAQVDWAYARTKSGGTVFLLVQVEREYFLFTGSQIPALYVGQVREWWVQHSLGQSNSLNADLLDLLFSCDSEAR